LEKNSSVKLQVKKCKAWVFPFYSTFFLDKKSGAKKSRRNPCLPAGRDAVAVLS